MTPVITTMAMAREASAPSMEHIAIARGDVMLRGRVASRRASGSPSNLETQGWRFGRWGAGGVAEMAGMARGGGGGGVDEVII